MLPRGGPSDPPRRLCPPTETPPFDAGSRPLLRFASRQHRGPCDWSLSGQSSRPSRPPSSMQDSPRGIHPPPPSYLPRRPPAANSHRGKPREDSANASSPINTGPSCTPTDVLHVRPKKSPRLCHGYTAAASPPPPLPISEPLTNHTFSAVPRCRSRPIPPLTSNTPLSYTQIRLGGLSPR